jgi:competence protein ComEA
MMSTHSNHDYLAYRARFRWVICVLLAGALMLSIAFKSPVQARPSAAASVATVGMQAADAHPEFPEGDGKDAVMRLCVRCHSPNIILASGQDRTGWENTITKMVRMGATGDDEDFSDIADYLTKNFPPSKIHKVFVNMATDKQIAEVLEIPLDQAKAIVAYRDQQKGFKDIDDMKKAPNVDAAKLDAKKDQLIFGAGSTVPAKP